MSSPLHTYITMGRQTTASGDEIRRYMEATGLSERTARLDRAQDSARWREVQADNPPPRDEVANAEQVVRESWEQWTLISARHAEALERGSGADTVANWNRAVSLAQQRYDTACKNLAQAQQRARSMVPKERVEAVRGTVERLGNVFQNLKNEIATRLPEAHRAAFFEAFNASMPAWNECITRIDKHIESLLKC